MLHKIVQIWKARDLRNNILFVLGMLVIFRLAAHIPVPGVDVAGLKQLFASSQILGLLNVFSGGVMENFSIVMMGVAPYITSSIIFQLLAMIIPQLEEMQKEESGRQRINMWTRWATVPLAIMQSYGMITLLRRSQYNILGNVSGFELFSMIIIITAGTVFLMWLGEIITEKKVGNGISLLIFAGIISALPQAVQKSLADIMFSGSAQLIQAEIFKLVGFAILAIVTVVGVVIITEAQRNVPVQYAKQVRGNRMFGGSNTHLPLRVNMAGVIPIIFAISVVLFPPMIAQFFVNARTAWVARAAEWTIRTSQDQLVYGVSYFLLVLDFTFFIPGCFYKPRKYAENYRSKGGLLRALDRAGIPANI